MSALFPEGLRRELFPFVADGVYLAAAAETPLPAPAAQAIHEYVAGYARRGMLAFDDTLGELERCRVALGRLLGGVDPEDIALLPNTTAGATAVAHSLPLWPGEVVLANDREFPTNLWPFEDAAAQAGATVERLVAPGGRPSADLAATRLAEGRPRAQAVAWSWVQYQDGYRTDLGALGEACRRAGAFLAVDAIQGLGAVPLDLKATPVDALYAGGHKWLLGTGGGGFLYVRRTSLEDLCDFGRGWLSVADPLAMDQDAPPRADARRYEGGNLSWDAFVALRVGVELLLEVGVEAAFAHNLALQDHLLRRLEGTGVRVRSSLEPAERGPMLALELPGADAGEVTAALRERGIVVTARDGALRVAPHLYNVGEDMDALVTAMLELGALRYRTR